MGETIMDQAATTPVPAQVDAMFQAELAKGDRALSGIAPVLSHMLASSGHALVNEDVVARLRGMLADSACQLLEAGQTDVSQSRPSQQSIEILADHLAETGPILSHFYALAMEAHLVRRLEQRSGLDPVLSPLLQELIASDHSETADLAMSTLAAQSRFIQAQRRMSFPLTELPAGLFHRVLQSWKNWTQHSRLPDGVSQQAAETKLRGSYDEAVTRLGLLTRLTGSMKKGAIAGLELDHAGLALFVTALSALTRQPRDLAVLACHDRQAARLALGLRAAGLEQNAIERQFLLLEPSERLPRELGEIDPEYAAYLLSQSTAWRGS